MRCQSLFITTMNNHQRRWHLITSGLTYRCECTKDAWKAHWGTTAQTTFRAHLGHIWAHPFSSVYINMTLVTQRDRLQHIHRLPVKKKVVVEKEVLKLCKTALEISSFLPSCKFHMRRNIFICFLPCKKCHFVEASCISLTTPSLKCIRNNLPAFGVTFNNLRK